MNEPLHKKNFQPDATCPLDGIRILDLSRLVSGNMISLQLADFGAEVIKVEAPDKGDPLRHWDVEGHGTAWKVYGRNKKSMTLNLRAPEGADILLKLAKDADVLIENFRPGTLEKTPFAPDKLRTLNPNLILVRVSGWGQTGPYKERLGFGSLVEGASGFASTNGFADREPVLPPLALADMVAGLSGAMSILVALRHRDQNGGGGQEIDLSLLEPIFSILGPQALNFKMTGEAPERTGSSSNTAAPRGVYQSKDGKWISMSASMQVMAERVLRAMGREDLITDPKFVTNGLRVKNNKELDPLVRAWMAERTLEENMAIFKRENITAAPVLDISQIVEDEHFREREILVEVPDEDLGSIPMHNIIPRLSDSPGHLRRPAPTLGQHTEEILGDLGLSADDLIRLSKDGVI
ncbi:MAG: CoA transferase [Rhodospirillaceae bacterium]|jgi:crotonobetainyl-CoA:carnitine CoA-transferase CaiB-like acyl-CoA transferase|nr:CoA transferase [Rhodospirillales bacterium]MBT3904069.1 CoA transferase [Rhodospirillaceae bacterium]MBT4701068.1 CoA transferase [Rhodospirillaceae bacterium]MBT5035286.1 CoA transferase [Rhodospirillaceae bacterium]MBT6222033.1 CoA transferase [Rhodospirillaceae bacterium]